MPSDCHACFRDPLRDQVADLRYECRRAPVGRFGKVGGEYDDDLGIDRVVLLLGRRRRGDPDISLAILGPDEGGRSRVVAQLRPQPVHEEVDITVRSLLVLRFDLVEQVAAAQKTLRIARQDEQERPFVAGERDLRAVTDREQAGFVENQITVSNGSHVPSSFPSAGIRRSEAIIALIAFRDAYHRFSGA